MMVTPGILRAQDTTISIFRVQVEDAVLADLKDRIAKTR